MQKNGVAGSAQESHANQTGQPPSIELSRGGGAIRGIDEKLSVNSATGTASQNIPIFTSPGRRSFSPELNLSYDSGAGNGIFGLGWNLSIPSITRKTEKGLPRYREDTESDSFILSGAEDLVPQLVKFGDDWQRLGHPVRVMDSVEYRIHRYLPRTEGLFARIERWTRCDDGDGHWRSVSKENITTVYGKSPQCRIADTDDAKRVSSWLIEESHDDKDNIIQYEYKQEDSENVSAVQV